MKVYIYQDELICESCANIIIDEQIELGTDSKSLPQGPYSDGGGESDRPQHCGQCRIFLENPLTEEGYKYVNSRSVPQSKVLLGRFL